MSRHIFPGLASFLTEVIKDAKELTKGTAPKRILSYNIIESHLVNGTYYQLSETKYTPIIVDVSEQEKRLAYRIAKLLDGSQNLAVIEKEDAKCYPASNSPVDIEKYHRELPTIKQQLPDLLLQKRALILSLSSSELLQAFSLYDEEGNYREEGFSRASVTVVANGIFKNNFISDFLFILNNAEVRETKLQHNILISTYRLIEKHYIPDLAQLILSYV